MDKFDKLIDRIKIEPHKASLADDIILKASRLQQKTTESFITILKNLFIELLNPKIALSFTALVIAVFWVGLNSSTTNGGNDVSESAFVIEEIYYAGL
ncbi:MAG TPA: hypothetical protein DIV86_03320 [Alphaproteobacteria bacterium]|nr:hypothetical protein [Alphaproteobacteria bacterium]